MEWGLTDDSCRYKVTVQERDGIATVTSISLDGQDVEPIGISIEAEGKPNRVLVDLDGASRLAHVARTGDTWWLHIDGRAHEVIFHEQSIRGSPSEGGSLKAPMPGTVLELVVKVGQKVREGQHLMTLEAMKMEHKVLAPSPGEISKINFSEGDRVDMGSSLVEITE
tara:strand:+ start:1593 stop:2093 length:501 start_codon:yes stop_codon:yes gene_type:complete